MPQSWRLARSLVVLRDEVRSRWPGTTFWTIGDADHRDSWSAHNPNAKGVVCAADILDDGGMDLDWFAEHIRTCGHRDLGYVIYRDRIASAGGPWRDYGGSYHSHVHVAVGNGPDGRSTRDYDHTDPWGIGPDTVTALRDLLEDDMATPYQMWAYTNENLTEEDAYAHLRGTRSDVRAIRAGQAAILAAVQGLDTAAVIAAVERTAAADADRDAQLLAELRDLATGGATAGQIVDALAARLGGVDEAP